MVVLSDGVDGRHNKAKEEADLETGMLSAAVDETEAVTETKTTTEASIPRDHSGRLDGSDMDTEVEDDLEMGKPSAEVDETEAVAEMEKKTEATIPSQHSAKMKIVSDAEFDAIRSKLEDSGTNWQNVVAELDTVCIQCEGSGRTLLHCFADGNRDLIVYLLVAGVPAVAKTICGNNQLVKAVRDGDLELCKLLCDDGADVNVSEYGSNLMKSAQAYGYYEVVDWLVHHPKFSPKWDYPVFWTLCEEKPELVVPYLNLFAVELPPRTHGYLANVIGVPGKDLNSVSGVEYRHLEEIYGLADFDVAKTPLALVIKLPVACEALACKVMHHIIKAKWKTFGQTMYRREVFLYMALVMAFSVSIVCNDATSPWNAFHGTRQHVVGIIRILAAIFSAVLLIRVERREAIVEGPAYFRSFWNLLGAGTYIGIIVIVICQASGAHSELLRVATCVLNITLWINMFQYLQMTRHFAVLVTMMSHMVSDVVKFILLYSMFLFGFSGGFHVLFVSSPGFETFVDALRTVLLMLFGQITLDPFNNATGLTWIVANLLLLVYLVSVVIVLLNLLIAMMSTSYGNVWDEAEGQVLLSYAQTIIRMEQSLTEADREKQINILQNDAESFRKRKQKAHDKVQKPEELQDLRKAVADRCGLPSYSPVRWLLGALHFLVGCLRLFLGWLFGGSTQPSQKSFDLRSNASTDCSTLGDGERWEVVQKKTGDDKQTELNTRVDKLTSLAEQQTAHFHRLSDSIATTTASVAVAKNEIVALSTRVDQFTTLVEQQTTLIKEQSDSIRLLACLLRAAEAKGQPPSPPTE